MEEAAEQKGFRLSVWKKVGPFLRPYRGSLLLIFGLMLFISLVDIAIPLFLRQAVDRFIVPGTSEGILPFTVLYVAFIVLQGLGVMWMARRAMHVEIHMGKDLKRAVFIHLQKLGLTYYNQHAVGWILARVMSDTDRISGVLAWSLTDLFWSIFYVAGVFIAMLILNWKLALLVILVVPFVALLTIFFQGKFLRAHREMRAANSAITGAYNEGITGAKTSKTLVIEQRNCRDFEKLTDEMYRASLRAQRLSALFIPIIIFFSSLAVALVLRQGGQMVLLQTLEFGVLSAFISYALGILEPVQQIARVLSEFIATQANIERVSRLLAEPITLADSPEVVEKYGDAFHPKRENWESMHGEIEFKDVWFQYPDGEEWILEDFNLKIPAGANVALVGETGAGKSTLVNLASRFYEPTKGQVLIDGVDYRERSLLWLHSQLGYVLQNPHLFSGSVRENIRYGRLEATDEEVYEAARLVSADLVLAKLAEGYDTDVGEGGDRLSTGEKQLISFARAVLADPPLFVLDEATSSIDTETEQLIQNAIAHILKGRTSFLVAHRLSTIRHADLILVVSAGKIVERGTHEELMEQKGVYHGLYTAMRLEELEAQAERAE
ncbi:ABC transporter ATP-binding protein/permease [Ruminococcaceae bacterium OttesenSCG-928-I18]|nr:ABC transporter ATP-binding protein/permease [Ruminococcaceae bacterium OttesenSCG-928-I18]